jgi:methionyl-tRNA formyltransferase
VGFAGTPGFAACALAAIHAQGCTIPVVLTQPDRPSGRGLAVAASAVKRFAVDRALPILQPASLKDAGVQSALAGISLDVLVVAAYGLILPQPVLDWPRHGCLNIHASLLPRWRGAAPIPRAIEAGDTTSGITIMRMDAGLDTGPIARAQAMALDPRETAGSLTDRLANLGAAMIVDALEELARGGDLAATPQPGAGATYAAKITRADTLLDWRQDGAALDRRIRALTPSPGAWAGWRGRPVKIQAAMPLDSGATAEPGTIVGIGTAGIDVACGNETVLRVVLLQPAGAKSMPARAFAAGHRVAAGGRFEPGAALPG